MSIANVIDSLKALSSKASLNVETKLHCEWRRGVEYGGVNEHTSLTGLVFSPFHLRQEDYYVKVFLTHKCPIGYFREKRITKAPYYCKQCAQCIISTDQGPSFCLPVDTSIVPKIQIYIAAPDYKKDPNTDFDIGDMVLTKYKGWVHKCEALAGQDARWTFTKQTLSELPYKCKLCRKRVCEEGMTLAKLTNMAKILGVMDKK